MGKKEKRWEQMRGAAMDVLEKLLLDEQTPSTVRLKIAEMLLAGQNGEPDLTAALRLLKGIYEEERAQRP